jgi:HD-like signal output (HDOD) protein
MPLQTATPSKRDERRRFRTPLDTDRVPVLPPGATYLMQALNDDNLGFREIAAAVEKMPSIAARILALANSAWSAPARPILALDEACGRLGIKVVQRSPYHSHSIQLAAQPSMHGPFGRRR